MRKFNWGLTTSCGTELTVLSYTTFTSFRVNWIEEGCTPLLFCSASKGWNECCAVQWTGAMAWYLGFALGVKLEIWRVIMSIGKESGGHEESLEKKRWDPALIMCSSSWQELRNVWLFKWILWWFLDGNNKCGYVPWFVLCYINCEIWSEWRVELSWIICVIAWCVCVCVCVHLFVCDVPQNP